MQRFRFALLILAALTSPSAARSTTKGVTTDLSSLGCLIECGMAAQQLLFSAQADQLIVSVCDVYSEAKACVKGCPGGSQTWRYGSSRLLGLKQLSQKCEPEEIASGAIKTLGAKRNEKLLGTFKCLVDCAVPGQGVIFQNSGNLVDNSCEIYMDAKECANNCPEGLKAWGYVAKRITSLKKLAQQCEPDDSVATSKGDQFGEVNQKPGWESSVDSVDRTMPTDTVNGKGISSGDSRKFTGFQCLIECAVTAQQALLTLEVSEVVTEACNIFEDTKACIGDCPNSAQIWLYGIRTLITLKKLKEKCESVTAGPNVGGNGEKRLGNQDNLSKAQPGASSLESFKCLIECAMPAQQMLFSLESDQISSYACSIYYDTKTCVLACPDADATWRYGSRRLISLYKLADRCNQWLPQSGRIIQEGEINQYESPLYDLNCYRKCGSPLAPLDGRPLTYGLVCDSFNQAIECIKSCPNGGVIVAHYDILYADVRRALNKCEPSMRPQLLSKADSDVIRGLAKDPISMCGRECHNKATRTRPGQSAGWICNQWDTNMNCLRECPRGDLLQRVAEVMATDKVINECITKSQTDDQKLEGQLNCDSSVDKEPEFCRKVQLASLEQFEEMYRYCDWRGFKSLCEGSCCGY